MKTIKPQEFYKGAEDRKYVPGLSEEFLNITLKAKFIKINKYIEPYKNSHFGQKIWFREGEGMLQSEEDFVTYICNARLYIKELSN